VAFLTGLILLDAPASALNNAGPLLEPASTNVKAVKHIRVRGQGIFPYVSAQAFRFWLRSTLEESPELEWKAAPVFREAKTAYTDANPIKYWDDDLFGYMRAPSKKPGAEEERREDQSREHQTPTSTGISRISPFRVSTFVALAPVSITRDYGTMSRNDGHPVPYEHEFYRTVLKGLISLNLQAAGTFSYASRTGYRNLDDVRIELAQTVGLAHINGREKAYRMNRRERLQRIAALLRGLAIMYGGARQTLHYTDVTPAILIATIMRGGNNPLQYLIGSDSNTGDIRVMPEAIHQTFRVWRQQILSKLYVGWVHGFADDQREQFKSELQAFNAQYPQKLDFTAGHPREVLEELITDLSSDIHADWLA